MPKKNIHPELKEARIECSCSNVFYTRSTRGSFKIDICSNCHPLFTGKEKLVDIEGRVQRFNRKYKRN